MLRVISYNIRYNNPGDGDHAWPYRKNRVTELLQHYQPDLIGLQEVLKNQLDDLVPQLSDYEWVGVGRDDGKTQGEFVPIFYRSTRFRLADSGNFWLSETPHVAGSVGWDASMTRMTSWAELIDKHNESRFLYLNTHFDHRGTSAQIESARLLRTFLVKCEPPLPAIITGDFNFTEASPAYQALTGLDDNKTPPYLDAMYLTQTPHEGPEETFNSNFTNPLKGKIDYIFVWQTRMVGASLEQNAPIQVHRHAILPDNQAGWYPSDHLPMMADILIS